MTIEHTHTPATEPACVVMAFDQPTLGAINHPGLTPLGAQPIYECWGDQIIDHDQEQDISWWQLDDETLLGAMSIYLAEHVENSTYQAYSKLLNFIKKSQFKHLIRIWNYLPHINRGSNDSEIYQLFCIGRANAFDQNPLASDQLPAGTAIGTQINSPLIVYFIASKRPGQQLENPRQVSAFEYPRQYSPRKPLFSRATIWQTQTHKNLIVSGTASIVGHQSLHLGDFQSQLEETWRNLEALRTTAKASRPVALRVYIRNKQDYAKAQAFLAANTWPETRIIYFLADVCREELLVEIEGVYRF